MPALKVGDHHPPIFAVVYRLALGPADDERREHPVIDYAAVNSPGFIHHIDGEWQFPR